tara:strand:+ start:2470 stop:3006 length:537 start_codon:yes stop_codon:yes gene_type:complete
MKEEKVRELLEECVYALTDGDFFINSKEDSRCIVYEIEVDRSEYGKICGAKGKMIRSIKYVWEACISRQIQKPIRVTLKEPSNGFSKGRQPNVPSEKFDPSWFHSLLTYVAEASIEGVVRQLEDEWSNESNRVSKWSVSCTCNTDINFNDYQNSLSNLFGGIAKANGGNARLQFTWID